MRRFLIPLMLLPLYACNQQEAAQAPAPEAAADVAAVPDFYRNSTPWSTGRGKNFEPPPPGSPGAAGPIGDHPDHPNFSNQSGRPPTPRIGDDTNPLLKPWAAAQMAKTREAILAGATPFDPAAHCWPPGVPAVASFGVASFYFLQNPDEVTIVYERGQIARHVYMNRPHSENVKLSWHGESVGHYEGDTLVVDTIGLDPRSFIDVFNVPHTDKLRVVERYTIVGNELQLVMTVEDPDTFTQPFSMYKAYTAGDEERMGEVICQEAGDDPFDPTAPRIPAATKVDF